MSQKPWGKREKESIPAYEAFTTYLLLGPERSTAKTAQTLRKSKKLIDGWCKRHDWVLRVGTYEEHFALRQLDATEDQRISLLRSHMSLAGISLERATARLRVLLDIVPETDSEGLPTDIKALERTGQVASVDQAIRLAELAVKVGRLATGLDGKYVPPEDTHTDVSQLDEDDLDKLEAILAKAKG